MSSSELQQIEKDLRRFTEKNFEKPGKCKNLEQIRYYVGELCQKIEELETKFSYAPQWLYSLLEQYNHVQNQMIYANAKGQ